MREGGDDTDNGENMLEKIELAIKLDKRGKRRKE